MMPIYRKMDSLCSDLNRFSNFDVALNKPM